VEPQKPDDVNGWLTLGGFSVYQDLARPVLAGSYLPLGFELEVSGLGPGTWTVEYTSNFLEWSTLVSTNTSAAQWNVSDALFPARFYRVFGQP